MGRLRHVWAGLAVLALAGCASAPAGVAGAAGCQLDYRVTVRHDTVPRVLEVSLAFPAEGRTESYLRISSGWGGVDDFAASFGSWRGADPRVAIEPTGVPQRFRVVHPAEGRARVEFQVKAALADPDDGKPQEHTQLFRPQIGADWFEFFGYGVLPSLEAFDDGRETRLCVTIAQPGQADPPVFGSHHAGRGREVTQRIAGSPRLLLHAFYAGGSGWRLVDRPLASGTLHLALRGQYGASDADFADKTAALIDTHRRFWNDTSLPQWIVFTPNNTLYDSGGTVVQRAAVMAVNKSFTPATDRFETLIGHENLHQWLPQRFGAHGSGPPDYWFSEGFTDYYTHRLLLASELWDLPKYATAMTRVLRTYWRSPARNASATSIAPRFYSDQDAGRQMYSRGELMALRWDKALRERGQPGLDQLLQPLLLPVRADTQSGALASARVLDAAERALGATARSDVKAYIDDGLDVPLPADLLGPCFVLGWADVPRWVRGFAEPSYAARKAIGVSEGGPAYRAGLREGMALVGWSVHDGDIGRDITLSVRVDGEVRQLRYAPLDGSSDRLPDVAVAPGAAADAACRSWVRRPG